ncbi:hypothetical protein [Amycolatopsis sp. 195334CR]|uniref:hypothetical protein n=1 Tax=Amycolatopsis sp. 195334CR TaxID=2814588 RepID=UPI001A8F69B0|nr:hypothetical protein [Amycolatopsis sp. 195334CR]MBN6037473.1 hypothetical protein [Amycolatopsis sp. 195334CR]
MSTWPPTLAQYKADQKVGESDTRDDERYRSNLDAAVAFVERVRPGFNYTDHPGSELPAPTADLALGTIRLAARWVARAKSPDAMVNMGEMGTGRVSSFDADIDRLLGIGRHQGPVFA